MNRKAVFFVVSLLITIVTIVIQSVVFPDLFKNDFMPDISLIATIYFSINYGRNIGQIFGFSTGLLLDSLSGYAFGLNALVRLVMGFFLGFFNGKIFMDKVVLPCIIVTVCTVLKFLIINLVDFIFPIDLYLNFFQMKYLIELGMNIVITPFVFLLFNNIARKVCPKREVV